MNGEVMRYYTDEGVRIVLYHNGQAVTINPHLELITLDPAEQAWLRPMGNTPVNQRTFIDIYELNGGTPEATDFLERIGALR